MNFEIDWNAAPQHIVAEIAGRADRLATPCGDGVMVWHRWPGPTRSAPTIVLYHGGFGSWTHWLKAVPLLSTRFAIVAADLPGLGDSADVAPPHTAQGISDIVNQGLDQILSPTGRCHLAGFSFGGIIAALSAAHLGERCLGFTAIGAAGFGELHHIVDGIKIPPGDLSEAEIDAVHAKNLSLLMLADAKRADPLALYLHRRNVERGRVRSRRISRSAALVETLPRITAPIGGLWGALDATGGGAAAIAERRRIFRRHQPGCRFTVIADAGHWIMYERPERFVRALFRHIDANDRPNR